MDRGPDLLVAFLPGLPPAKGPIVDYRGFDAPLSRWARIARASPRKSFNRSVGCSVENPDPYDDPYIMSNDSKHDLAAFPPIAPRPRRGAEPPLDHRVDRLGLPPLSMLLSCRTAASSTVATSRSAASPRAGHAAARSACGRRGTRTYSRIRWPSKSASAKSVPIRVRPTARPDDALNSAGSEAGPRPRTAASASRVRQSVARATFGYFKQVVS